MSGQIETYKDEVFNFLRTVTIKFEPFAYLMGQSYMDQYGLIDPHAAWNPYYINLSGKYSAGDKQMTVYSPEVEKFVPYDENLLKDYPRTAALYRVGNKEYDILVERYPENTGLIQTIAYPVESISAAINAKNLTLLAYDDSFLHINERETLVKCLRDFLDMVRTRWWINEFTYEDMFAMTFWGMIWQYLPVLLLTQRFLNIKTPYVHPFHIWEYLKSRGLGDYRDVLTNRQSLWLYRNINYVLKNKGKNSNLLILAENILGEIFISLLYKDMYQETSTRWKDVATNPVFRSFNITTDKEIKTENFRTLNERLVNLNIENRYSADYIEATEKALGTHSFNILPTKFLELKKESINTGNEQLMINFFLDTLMYRFSNNDLSFNCIIVEPVNRTTIKLYVGDMIALWYYSIMKATGIEPTVLPTKYQSYLAFNRLQPEVSDLQQSIFFNGVEYPIKTQINASGMIEKIGWHPRSFTKQTEFMEFLVKQLRALLSFNRDGDQSNKYTYHEAMRSFFRDTTNRKCFPVTLSPRKTYASWIHENEFVEATIDLYNDNGDKNLYKKLAELCFDSIFPLDKAASDEFLGNVRNMEKIYISVRDLFIRLCSYNVTYLETDRDQHEYVRILDPDVHRDTTEYDFPGMFDFIADIPRVEMGDFSHEIGIDDIDIEFIIRKKQELISNKEKICVDYVYKWDSEWANNRLIRKADIPAIEKTSILENRIRIDTGVFSVIPKG